MKTINDLKSADNKKQDSVPTTDADMNEFIAWCKEFNVSIMVGKTQGFSVLVGDQIKYVKHDSL